MNRTIKTAVFTFLFAFFLPLQARAEELLVPGGQLIGLELSDDSVTVAAYDDALGTAARESGLKIGDEILEIDGRPIDCAQDVRIALNRCDGSLEVLVRRGGKHQTLQLAPQSTADGPRLGIFLRQGIAGIGTVTFFDPDTHRFGTLGHGVSDAKGVLLNMRQGNAYSAKIIGTNGVTGALGRDHDNVYVLGGLDAAEVNVEAVCESKGLAFGKIGFDALLVELSLLFVVDEDHDEIRVLCSVSGGHNLESSSLCLCPALASLVKTYDNVNARILEVERVSVSLRTVTDDSYCLAAEFIEITILLIINVCHGFSWATSPTICCTLTTWHNLSATA